MCTEISLVLKLPAICRIWSTQDNGRCWCSGAGACTWSLSCSTGNWIPSFTRGGAAKKMIFIQLLPCLVLGMQIFVTTTSSREPPPAVEQYSNHIGGQHLLPGWLPRLPVQLSSTRVGSAWLSWLVANHSIKTSLGVAVLRGVCWKIEIETSEFLL